MGLTQVYNGMSVTLHGNATQRSASLANLMALPQVRYIYGITTCALARTHDHDSVKWPGVTDRPHITIICSEFLARALSGLLCRETLIEQQNLESEKRMDEVELLK